jgi:L-ribulose-5-phosphate 4-epimerase
MYHKLKQQVHDANMALQRHGLVVFTWGNVSGIDRAHGVVAIKPSGVRYEDLTPESIVVLDLEGKVVEGDLRPSSDTSTHMELYRCFEGLGGICHTHSTHATMWAQAQAAMCGMKDTTFKPIAENHEVYQRLYRLYKQLHDGFGLRDKAIAMGNVMKELLDIKEKAGA